MNNPAVRIRKAVLSLLILSIAPLAHSADSAAQRAAGSVSPDGKWECRQGSADEEPTSDSVFVVAKRSSQEGAVELSGEASGTWADNARIIWAPDSKRFAFNYQPGLRDKAAQFFQLEGGEWRELDPPGSDEAVMAPIARSMAAQRKKLKLSPSKTGRPISDGCEVRRWLGPDTALLYVYSHETFEIKKELEQVGEACFVTLKFRPSGEWKVVRTAIVPDEGLAGLTKEERDELARVHKESEEAD